MASNELIWMDWFNNDHEIEVRRCFANNHLVLRRSQLLTKALKEWLCETLAKELQDMDNFDTQELLEDESKWWKKQQRAPSEDDKAGRARYLERKNINQEILHEKLKIEKACRDWAKETWQSSLSQMYLDQKDKFDEVTFKLLRLKSEEKHLANELYHRLKAQEVSFEEIALTFGNGPERLPGGCLNKLTLNAPQPQLAARLRRMQPGELSLPFKVAEWILLVEMISTKPAQLNEQIEGILLDQALENFLKFGADKLSYYLYQTPIEPSKEIESN